MSANYETLPVAATTNTKPLWAAVGVLSVAVLAMGGGLIYVQTRPAVPMEPVVASAPALETKPVPQAVSAAQSIAANEEVVTAPPPKPAVVATKPVQAKPKPALAAKPVAPAVVVEAPAPAPVVVAAAETSPSVVIDHGVLASQPAPPVAKPICASCGTIESVTPVERQGKGSGTGAVAGGVLGAVVGNQVGHGGGRTAATLLGALGGGFAGNAIEKHVKKETVYQVRVRMEDGSTRTVEQASLPAVGTRVTVNNGVLHAAYGG